MYALSKAGLLGAHDLWADMRFADGSTVHMWEYNPSFNYPSVGFGDGSNWNRYYVNETFNKTENGHTFTVTRNPDPDVPWKELGDHGYVKNFHIHITS